jgi:hypothetical protein
MQSLKDVILNTLKNAETPVSRSLIFERNRDYFASIPGPKALNNISKELHLLAEEGFVENEIQRPTGIVAWKLKMPPADAALARDVAAKEAETAEVDLAIAQASECPLKDARAFVRQVELVEGLSSPPDPERFEKLKLLDVQLDALARTVNQEPVEVPPIADLDIKLKVLYRLSPMLAGDIGQVLDSIRDDLITFNELRA